MINFNKIKLNLNEFKNNEFKFFKPEEDKPVTPEQLKQEYDNLLEEIPLDIHKYFIETSIKFTGLKYYNEQDINYLLDEVNTLRETINELTTQLTKDLPNVTNNK